MTYESALEELQSILSDLQSETVKVDDLEEKTKRAAELMAFCKEKLRKVDENVNKILDF